MKSINIEPVVAEPTVPVSAPVGKSNRMDEKLDVNDDAPGIGIRGNVSAWTGGTSIKLDKKDKKSGKTIRDRLADHLHTTVTQELKNHEPLVENIKRWNRLYKGVREAKGFPYEGVANTATLVPRSDTDAVFVRAWNTLFNKRRIYLMKLIGDSTSDEQTELRKVEDAFDHYMRNVVKLKDKCRWPMMQGVKTGTGIVKITYDTDTRTFYRYANDEDLDNESLDKYKAEGTDSYLVKEEAIVSKGPNLYAWPREDVLVSSDAYTIDDAYMVAARFPMRKAELDARAANGVYYEEAVKKLTPDEHTDSKKERVEGHGVELEKTEYEQPYELWEVWTKFDVDGDGQEDDICVVFHLGTRQILSGIYNPIFYGYKPFIDLKGSPVEFAYDGEGVCEIIEQAADEVDALHNLRLDRLAQINLPIVIMKTASGIKKFTLSPGKVWYADTAENLNDIMRVITSPNTYNTLLQEEGNLINQMDRGIGITTGSLGISTAERPVFKDTVALQEEANKKFQNWFDNFRSGLLEIGYKFLECFAQYQPTYEYTDKSGAVQKIKMPVGNIRSRIKLDMEVSTEQMNLEVRKQTDLLKYNLLKDYMQNMGPLVQAYVNPNTPEDMKRYILGVGDIGYKTLTRVLEDFDERDPEGLVLQLSDVVDVDKGLANTPENRPQTPPPPQGMPPGGQMGGPGGRPPGGPPPGMQGPPPGGQPPMTGQ